MASAPRLGRKGGKVSASPIASAIALTPGNSTSPASLQISGEGTTIIGDPNAAHPFGLDVFSTSKKSTPSTNSVLQFDFDAVQLLGKGVVVGRAKQVRTRIQQPESDPKAVRKKLNGVFSAKRSTTSHNIDALEVGKLGDRGIAAVRTPQEALSLVPTILFSDQSAKVLVVVSKYHELYHVKSNLSTLLRGGRRHDVTVGAVFGHAFDGDSSARVWVMGVETVLLYMTQLGTITPFTHVVVPCYLGTASLLSCFVKMFAQWMVSEAHCSRVLRLFVTTDCDSNSDVARMIGVPRVTLLSKNVTQPYELSYSDVCALLGRETMEIDLDAARKVSSPPKKLVDYIVEVATELVRYVVANSFTPQVFCIFTGDVREVLNALQEAGIGDCAVCSTLKSSACRVGSKHCVHVMNHVSHALDARNDFTMVLDMGTIRRASVQHKSESFIAGSTTEWESKADQRERKSILCGNDAGCYVALFQTDIGASFQDDAQALPDLFDVENIFVQCARLNLPMNEVKELLPSISCEVVDQVTQKIAERCIVSSPDNLKLTFLGEVKSRLPVEIDVAHLITCGCSLGLGEVALVIGAVVAIPFRSTSPDNTTHSEWAQATLESRKRYGGAVASCSDLLADALVFLEWLKLRVSGRPTSALLEEIAVQELRFEKVEGLMYHMRDQLSNYAFLERLEDVSSVNKVGETLVSNAPTMLILLSTALSCRTAFVRDAGRLKEKDRSASMVFVRTSKQLVVHSFIPSGVKWETGGIVVPVVLKNSGTILGGIFSLTDTRRFFASLLLLYPQVEYSRPSTTGKGNVVYFSVSCNWQMKRFVVSIDEATQILDFRESINTAMGCMQAMRRLPHPISKTKFAIALKEHERLFDMERLHKELQRQLLSLTSSLKVQEHQCSFETFEKHCIAPKEIIPPSGVPATDVLLLHRFADGTLWEKGCASPQSVVAAGSTPQKSSATTPFGAVTAVFDEDDDDDVQIIQNSYFMLHGPLIEDDDDD